MTTTSRPAHVAAIAATALLTCTFAISALAQDCPELVGVVSDPQITGVAASDGYAYVVWAEGSLFEVFDMSTPSDPIWVGGVVLPRGFGVSPLADVAVFEEHVYVVTSGCSDLAPLCHSDLVVIDVSTPSAPAGVGSMEWSWPDALRARAVAVSDGHAYVAFDGSGVRVIDVSTPSVPVEVGSIDTPGGTLDLDVAVSGDYAYVAWSNRNSGEGGLRMIDVSTPSAPVEVGFVDRPGSASCVAVVGGYAYVGGDGISVIDVSTPSAPVEVGFVETPKTPTTSQFRTNLCT